MSATALLFVVAPRPIVGLYLDLSAAANADVVALAVRLLGVAALFQVFDGLQVAMHGALQGLKDTRVPMGIAAVTYWGVGLTTGYFWGVQAGSPEGLWWGLVVGLAAAAVLLIGRFHRQVEAAVRGAQGDGPGETAVRIPAESASPRSAEGTASASSAD